MACVDDNRLEVKVSATERVAVAVEAVESSGGMAYVDGDLGEVKVSAKERVAAAVEAVEAIGSRLGDWEFWSAYGRQLLVLSHRIRFLGPLAEELKEMCPASVSEGEEQALALLADALQKALELLQSGREGSRVFLILEKDNLMQELRKVTANLEEALHGFQCSKLDISDDVKEQVQLTHSQFRRAKQQVDMHRQTHSQFRTQNPKMVPAIASKLMDPDDIPNEFLCPISLEVMEDPVIIATGQTYDRRSIQKHLDMSRMCPKTGQWIANTSLTPNCVLERLITQRCHLNRSKPRKCLPQPNWSGSSCSSSERGMVDDLLSKLQHPDPEEQKSAVEVLRILAKSNANSRIFIAEAGGIPLLLRLLLSSDLKTQEHAITVVLNLSVHVDNKARIISSGAVPGIVFVLMNGSMEARENAAATVFSLSVIDEFKVTIGRTRAIPALVIFLGQGSERGKKDALAALFSLCIYPGNKRAAIQAGLVPLLIGLMANSTIPLMDMSMAILSMLSSQPEGKAAIEAANPVPMLVAMIDISLPGTRESATEVLLNLCSEQDVHHLAHAHKCNIMAPLRELATYGAEPEKKKAVQLLLRICRFIFALLEEHDGQLPASGMEEIKL